MYRKASKACSAVANTWYSVLWPKEIVINGKPILSKNQLKSEEEKNAFKELLNRPPKHFFDNAAQCVLNQSEAGYFAAKGLVAWYVCPEFDAEFISNRCKCYASLKVVHIEKPQENQKIDYSEGNLILVGENQD